MSGVCKQPEDTTVKQTSRASDETKKKKKDVKRVISSLVDPSRAG